MLELIALQSSLFFDALSVYCPGPFASERFAIQKGCSRLAMNGC
jgi:hypothetical protein